MEIPKDGPPLSELGPIHCATPGISGVIFIDGWMVQCSEMNEIYVEAEI